MNIVALDTEGPKFDKKEPWRGNAYGDSRSLVCYSWASENGAWAKHWNRDEVQAICDGADLVVGFNLKHDVTWMRKCGVDVSNIRIWDCQLAEFVISRQLNKFPSLNDCATRLGLNPKLDVVKTEYWDKGIDTIDVPWPILSEYAAYDSDLTLQCYHRQLEELTPRQKMLVSLMSQDLLVLQEMEWNGLLLDEDLCEQKAKELDNKISEITSDLSATYPGIPINFGSPIQLSAFLYGGTITEVKKEHVGFYKTGLKKGEPKLQNKEHVHTLPRLFQPIKGTEGDKEGVWSTAEPVLKKLKGNKKILSLLLELAKLDKQNGTYYKGLPKVRQEHNWPKGKLHGQLNQTLATTGRLSSSKPNQQNMATELQNILISAYE